MKSKIFAVIFLLTAAVNSVSAQQMIRMKAEPGKTFMLSELGAFVITEGEKTTVKFVAPSEVRPKKYQEIDIQSGDEIVMVNGKKVKIAKDIEDSYKNLKVGETFKLGVKRNGNSMLISYEKADEKDFPKRMMINKEIGPDGKEKITDQDGKEVKVKNGKAVINGKEVDLNHPPKDAKIEVDDNK